MLILFYFFNSKNSIKLYGQLSIGFDYENKFKIKLKEI